MMYNYDHMQGKGYPLQNVSINALCENDYNHRQAAYDYRKKDA